MWAGWWHGTEANYREYVRNRTQCGMQGVGPTQLTYYTFQDRADQLGGCWRPEINIRVGFESLQTTSAPVACVMHSAVTTRANRATVLMPAMR